MGLDHRTAVPTRRQRRFTHAAVAAALGGGLAASAAPWWAWCTLFAGLWLVAAAMRRASPRHLLTRSSA
ncbi:hypothetical protein [Saccharothrix sp. Mg75]|uniref:hypothetical protein n=1 Tax=Saccharothrix sp. Mg75 TaxID=3445357 RepID=UPI003EEF385B